MLISKPEYSTRSARGLLWTLALIVGAVLTPALAQAEPKVVNYYHALTKQFAAVEPAYKLVQKSGQWITHAPDLEFDFPVLVDGGNGYLLIDDEGTGGGNFQTEVVYWNTEDGPLLGMAETSYLPPYPDRTRIRFFTRFNDRWSEVSGYVWPSITLADFMRPDMTIQDLRVLEQIGAQVYVKLPQKGLDAEAWLVMRTSHVNAVCNGEYWLVVPDKAPYLYYCNQLQARLSNHMVVDWNKAEGIFRKGQLSRHNQPWN
jgi:hypothetical protein